MKQTILYIKPTGAVYQMNIWVNGELRKDLKNSGGVDNLVLSYLKSIGMLPDVHTTNSPKQYESHLPEGWTINHAWEKGKLDGWHIVVITRP